MGGPVSATIPDLSGVCVCVGGGGGDPHTRPVTGAPLSHLGESFNYPFYGIGIT